jgi:two-component system NtrC family response regulator
MNAEGFTCGEFWISAENALENFVPGLFDVLIKDFRLPGMDGIELLREVRHHDPFVVSVLITVYATVETTVML